MNLVIDIGNTRVKIAVFKENTMLNNDSFSLETFLDNIEKITQKYTITHAIVSSVGNLKNEYKKFLNSSVKVLTLTHKTKIPFTSKYKTPQTLGVDRIALIAAAVRKFPNKNVLVIDAGTCITYDFIDASNTYLGGAISPGIFIRYKALHQFTANLPLLEPNSYKLIGKDTESSIHSGVLNGLIHEIDGVIGKYSSKYSNLTIVLTGGDTNFLAKKLKSSIFANPNFLLEGLNSILIYNKDI